MSKDEKATGQPEDEAEQSPETKSEQATKPKTVWYKIRLPITSIKARSDKTVKIDIPKVDGEVGFVFWANKNFIKHEGEKEFDLILPDRTPSGELSKFTLKDGIAEKIKNASELAEILKDYNVNEQELMTKPSEMFQKLNLKRLIATHDNFPSELKELPNFLVYKVRKAENGKFNKKLLDSNHYDGLSWGRADDPQSWTTFDEAIKIAKKDNCSGVAFVLTKDSPYACIDLDHCVSDGKYSETASELIEKSKGTYAERSVSKNGVHIFFKCGDLKLRTVNEDKTIEFFQGTNKIISLTGDMLPDSKKELIEFGPDSELVQALQSKLPKKTVEQVSEQRRPQQTLRLSDAELIEKAKSSRDGARFTALYNGENVNGNRSDSDMALMSRLAFWTAGDKERMISIFNTSGLARTTNEKPNYDSYLQTTAEKAIELNKGKAFSPKQKSEFRPKKASETSEKQPNKGEKSK